MFRKKYAFFYVYSIMMVIYTFNVQVTNCQIQNGSIEERGREEDKHRGEDPPETDDPQGENEKIAKIKMQLEQLMTVPQMPFVTVPYTVVFEAVDYDHLKEISPESYELYYDCYYWYTRCIRDLVNFQTVCVYEGYSAWGHYSTLCQVELENCKHRTMVVYWKKSQGIFGTYEGDYYDISYIKYYHGDGWQCENSFRRNNVPDDRVNFYFEDQYRRTMREIEENYNGTI